MFLYILVFSKYMIYYLNIFKIFINLYLIIHVKSIRFIKCVFKYDMFIIIFFKKNILSYCMLFTYVLYVFIYKDNKSYNYNC